MTTRTASGQVAIKRAAQPRASTPKYPAAKVRLVGEDGNAFAILGRTKRALRGAGASPEEIAAFFREATAGDYDQLLGTVLRWVEVE